MGNSRNDMNETLCTLFQDSLFTEISTPERLIMEHAMLISVLHANVGSEIGAHFLQFTVIKFKKLLDDNVSVENKEINNILIFIMHLYNFQVYKIFFFQDSLARFHKPLLHTDIFKIYNFNR